MGIDATLVDMYHEGKRLTVIGTLAFSGNYATGGVTVNFATAGVRSDAPPVWLNVPLYRGYSFSYVPGDSSREGKLKVFGSGNTAATAVLTSDNTNVADGATVTIGSKVYTFKTALTPTEGQVLIGADADASLLNLSRAINHTGTPNTDYKCAAANTQVSASATVTAHAITITALVSGAAGNSIAVDESSTHLSWGAATLTSGTDTNTNGAELDAAAFPTDLQASAVPFHGVFLPFQ